MKASILVAGFMMLCAGTFAQEFKPLATGSHIPLAQTKMKSIQGNEVAIKDVVRKNGVLVMFSCNTCPVVKKYQSRTLAAVREAAANEVGVIIINSNEANRSDEDSYTAMQQYAKQQQYINVPYVVDEKSALANAFGATRTPECFLFDAKGKLVYHGAIDDNQEAASVQRQHLVLAMSEMKAGKAVAVKETRSVGCGIKRAE